MANRIHVVRTQQPPSPAVAPHARWARWVCTCGRRSKLFARDQFAEAGGRSHAKATGGRFNEAVRHA